MNYYPFHIGDYHLATAHLEPLEDLAYRRLMDFYYQTELPIPKETQSVSRRLRLGSDLVNSVLSEFFIETENGWIHVRCDEEIAKYRAKQEAAQLNGKLGGRPKKTQSVILANPDLTGSKANQNHNQNQDKHKPLSESDNSSDGSFTRFWFAYPKKSGKGAAEKAWKAIKRPNETVELMLTAIEWQRKSPQWTKDNGQYIPNPATYINQRRWEDEMEVAGHEGMTDEEICAANLAAFKERMK